MLCLFFYIWSINYKKHVGQFDMMMPRFQSLNMQITYFENAGNYHHLMAHDIFHAKKSLGLGIQIVRFEYI